MKALLREKELEAKMVENCGMEGERIYQSMEEIPDQAGYYSLLVVKERSDKSGGKEKEEQAMITFVGAGPGAADLITLRGQRLLQEADVVIYAGSLVNPELLSLCRESCRVYNSAEMTLEEVMDVMEKGEAQGLQVVRLHTGDPCLYGAIKEQMDCLDEQGIAYDVCPGVSSFCGAAAALGAEYTLPGVVPVCGDHPHGGKNAGA